MGPSCLSFRKFDLLVDQEIVDDLLLVQQDIESYLLHTVTQTSRKPMSMEQVKALMSEQERLLTRIKDGILNALEAQQRDD